jgi:hypothetical protein
MECFNYPYMSIIGTVLLLMKTVHYCGYFSPFGYMYGYMHRYMQQ